MVRQAIRFENPERIPIWFVNCDQTEGDVMVYHLSLDKEGEANRGTNEWGYRLEKLDDGTMGHPTKPSLPDWESADALRRRRFARRSGWRRLPAYFERCERPLPAGEPRLVGLHGLHAAARLREQHDGFSRRARAPARLMDMIFDCECDMMALVARRGFHGIHFADDWGTQTGLMISPALWRKLFKPRYRQQFARARNLGLHIWFHCCGNLAEIVEDFHEIGVDVLNIAQPNVVDVAGGRRRLRGRQCFLMPISYQTVSISGTPEEIYAEAQRLYDLLGTPAAGSSATSRSTAAWACRRRTTAPAPRLSAACGRLWGLVALPRDLDFRFDFPLFSPSSFYP